MRTATEIEKDLLAIKSRGEKWVLDSVPLVIELTDAIKTKEDEKKGRLAPVKVILETIAAEVDEELMPFKVIDEHIREKIMANHESTEAIKVDKVGSYSFPERWTFNVKNLDKVPTEFLMLDNGKVRDALKNGQVKIKGLLIEKRRDLTITRAK